VIDAVITGFGLARMPFGRDLLPSRLHRHRDCGEAAARITWAVADKTICMVTGEVGTGKTVAIRAAVADLDPASHTVIYIGNPSTGVRGILAHVVTALGGRPVHGTRPSPSRHGTSWQARQPSEGEPRCWPSTRHTSSTTIS
jgi:type II secretory pathway predicted ATPase ExeA